MVRFTRRRWLIAFAALAPLSLAAADKKISDDLLFDQVSRALVSDPQLGAHPLQVAVQDGKVTISGLVDNDKLRKRVNKIVEKVKGVLEIENLVRVRQ